MRSSARSRLGLCLLLLLLLFAAGLGLSTSLRGVTWAASPPHIWRSQKVGTTTTDPIGKFAVRITVPKTALPGTHTVQATGQSSRLTAPTSFLVQTDWSQFCFRPSHTGYNPYENVLTPSNASALTLDGSYATGGTYRYSSPTVVNGVVYVGSNGTLYALDAITGTLKWSYTTGDGISSPVVVNGVVYIGSNKGLYTFHLPGVS